MTAERTGGRILVVDDDALNRKLLERILAPQGYIIRHADCGAAALEIVANEPVDIVLLDLIMPQMTGIEVCQEMRKITGCEQLPVIMVTALTDRDARLRGKAAGCDDFLTKPVDSVELLIRVRNLLYVKLYHQHLTQYNVELERRIQERTAELNDALVRVADAEKRVRRSRQDVIMRLARAAEFRDNETGQHIQRMSRYCHLLAQLSGHPDDHCELILVASPLHDVGKIGMPDSILLKPGPLTKEERRVVEEHPDIGRRILDGSDSDLLQMACSIAWTHHEKWDGTGYPRKLAGTSIPIEGRICGIADVFDALTSSRAYKPAFSIDRSTTIMREGRANHFDPELLDLFLDNLDAFLAIRESYCDEAQCP